MGDLWWCNLCRIIQIPQSCCVDLNALTAVNLLRLAVSAWCQRLYCLHTEEPVLNEITFADLFPRNDSKSRWTTSSNASIADAAPWLSILKTAWCVEIAIYSFRCVGNVSHQLCDYKSTRSHFSWRQCLAGDAQTINVDDPSAEIIKSFRSNWIHFWIMLLDSSCWKHFPQQAAYNHGVIIETHLIKLEENTHYILLQ